jgi:hypothetical protein
VTAAAMMTKVLCCSIASNGDGDENAKVLLNNGLPLHESEKFVSFFGRHMPLREVMWHWRSYAMMAMFMCISGSGLLVINNVQVCVCAGVMTTWLGLSCLVIMSATWTGLDWLSLFLSCCCTVSCCPLLLLFLAAAVLYCPCSLLLPSFTVAVPCCCSQAIAESVLHCRFFTFTLLLPLYLFTFIIIEHHCHVRSLKYIWLHCSMHASHTVGIWSVMDREIPTTTTLLSLPWH